MLMADKLNLLGFRLNACRKSASNAIEASWLHADLTGRISHLPLLDRFLFVVENTGYKDLSKGRLAGVAARVNH